MKKTLTVSSAFQLFALCLMLTSCIYSQSPISVRGSGTSTEKVYSVSDFHAIEVSGGFDVILSQGNSEGVIITAQENLFEHIHVEVAGGVLKIYSGGNMNPTQSLKAHITFKLIDNIKISGGGDVICETPLNVPQLGLTLSGGGDLSCETITNELICRISGGGDARINGSIKKYDLKISGGGDLFSEADANVISCNISGGGDISFKSKEKVSEANIVVSGGGDLELKMNAGTLKCSISGGGDASMTGQASVFDLSISSGGDVNAGNFSTGTTIFNVSGGSDIHVNVSKELKGTISGGGDVYYSGNPETVSVDTNGGSEVHKE